MLTPSPRPSSPPLIVPRIASPAPENASNKPLQSDEKRWSARQSVNLEQSERTYFERVPISCPTALPWLKAR